MLEDYRIVVIIGFTILFILGLVLFIYTVGGAIGPVMTGQVFDMTGSYIPAFMTCIMIVIVTVILILSLKPLIGDNGDPAV